MATNGFAAQLAVPTPDQTSPVIVAAGSLRSALDEIIELYQRQSGVVFTTRYGPSGKLRQEIESGVKVDVFASASSEHTQALAQQKLLGPSEIFTHNDLCVVAKAELKLTTENMLHVLSMPVVRVATSTPLSDPMGDYTWQFFKNAERKHTGFYDLLNAKALQLSGSKVPLAGEKLPYITAFEDNKADAYIMYCTNAVVTKNALPQLTVLRIDDELNVRSEYGIAADLKSSTGKDFVRFIMQVPAQNILKKHGFD